MAPAAGRNDDLPELGGHIPFEQCLSEMALAGFTGTEIGNKYPKDPDQLNAALKLRGLTVSSNWVSCWFSEGKRRESIDHFTAQAAFLKAVGAEHVNICECGHAILDTRKPVLTEPQWQDLVDGLHTLGKIARDMGLTMIYHFHMGTCVQTRDEIDTLMQRTDPALVGLLLDTGHITFAGSDALALTEDYKDRIHYVHLKDIRPAILEQVKPENWSFLEAVKAGVFTVPGDGCIAFKPILKTLRDCSASGCNTRLPDRNLLSAALFRRTEFQ